MRKTACPKHGFKICHCVLPVKKGKAKDKLTEIAKLDLYRRLVTVKDLVKSHRFLAHESNLIAIDKCADEAIRFFKTLFPDYPF